MVMLAFVLLSVVASIGLLLCSIAMRSKSLATLNFFVWVLVMFAVSPWSTLSPDIPRESGARLMWNAALIWAVFFTIALINWLCFLTLSKDAKKPPKSRRRRRRTRGSGSGRPAEAPVTDDGASDAGVESTGTEVDTHSV